MKEFLLGIVAVMFARFGLGVDWFVAAMFFPLVRKLVAALLENDGYSLSRSLFAFLAFVIAAFFHQQLYGISMSMLHSCGIRMPSSVQTYLFSFAVAFIMYLASNIVAMVAAEIFGPFRLPQRASSIVSTLVGGLANMLAILCVVVVVRHMDGHLVRIAPLAKMLISLAVGIGFLLSGVRLFIGLAEAFKPTPPSESRQKPGAASATVAPQLCVRPKTRLADVAGMDDAKEQVRLRLVEPIRNPEKARRYGLAVGGGMLLYGPPGTGKTFFARAVAGELNLPFYTISAADIFGSLVGESEKNVKSLFREIRSNALSVVFIDELETIFPKRSADVHETTRKVISLLLQELDGLDKEKNPVLLIGATNVPWMVDEAFLRPGRFDVRIYVGNPDLAARRLMAQIMFAKGKVPHDRGLDDYIAERTEGFSGADMNGLFEKMRQIAFMRGLPSYTLGVVDEVLRGYAPVNRDQIIRQLKAWAADNARDNGASPVRLTDEGNIV